MGAKMAEEKLFGVPSAAPVLFGVPSTSRDPEDEYDPTEYEGVSQEFYEGVASGATKIVQGVAELGALGYDAVNGTDYASDVSEGFENFRNDLGIDPQGISGAIGEVGMQFVVPGGLAVKGIQGLNAVAKAGKAGKFFASLGAAGLADAVTSTRDTSTIGDFFEGGPTETTDLIGLEGEERALEGLLNKAKVGFEGAAGIVAAPFIVKGVTGAASAAATAAGQIPGATQVARGIQAGARKVGGKLAEIENAKTLGLQQNPIKNGIAETLAVFRYRGILPESVAESRSLIPGLTEAEVRTADKLSNLVDKELDKFVTAANKKLEGGTPFAKADAYNTIDKYLTLPDRKQANELLKLFPDEMIAPLTKMRTHLNELSTKFLKSDYLKKNDHTPVGSKKLLSEIIRGNLGSYMRRRYRLFEDASYKPSDEVLQQAAKGFKLDPVAVQSELELIARSPDPRTAQDLGLSDEFKLQGWVTDKQAEIARDAFLARHKGKIKGSTLEGTSRVGEQKLRTDLFITRSNIKDYQKALLGEVKNPLENYVATVSDMAEFNAVDNYFATIRAAAKASPDGIGKLFRETPAANGQVLSAQEAKNLADEGYVVLGSGKGSSKADKAIDEDRATSGWGSLHGFAVPKRVYRDLTRTVIGDTGVIGNALRATYSGFLRVKGGTQYGKTILSPITQIRNVTTASAFAAAQGNIGKGANLWESVGLVFNNMKNLPPEKAAALYKELQREGIVNSQAELRELQELVAKGFGYNDDAIGEGFSSVRKFGSKITDNPIIGFFKTAGKKAENLYQGGDDIWKVYNYTFEMNKLRNALSKMEPKAQAKYIESKVGMPMDLDTYISKTAGRIVRNNIPNYNLAPEVIKSLRRAPLGNFIAFPYEIMRTGVNTIARGIDELADANVEIQKIGLRRLTGAMTTFSLLPSGLTGLAYATSGVTKEEMDAYQENLAAPWERYARLLPTGRHKDGTPRFINYSYSNPYDMLERVARTAIDKFEKGVRDDKNGAQIVSDAAFASFGELMDPFLTESIALGAFRDVLDPAAENSMMRMLGVVGRGGKTITGSKIYNPQDSAGDKVAKSFAHLADVLLPAIIPIDESGGKIEPSRFARGFINGLNLNETLGVSEKDRMGRERDLTQELARIFTGVSESESQATDSLKYKGYEFARNRQESANIFNSEARRQNITQEQLLEAYKNANEARYRAFNDFHRTLKAVDLFGMNKGEVARVLKEANVGGIKGLLGDVYEPFEISKSVLADMARNGTIDQVPFKDIGLIQSEQYKRKFGDLNFEPAPSVQEVPLFGVPSQQPPQQEVPLFGVPSQQPLQQEGSLQVPAAPTRTAAVNPAILGDNPMDVARNMEIASLSRS